MKKKLLTMVLAIPVMIAMLLTMCVSPVQGAYVTDIDSGFATTAPTLDGNFTTENEWSGAGVTSWWFEPESAHYDNYIYLYFMNDNENLYIMVDLTPDNSSEYNDYVAIGFDENNDDIFEADSGQQYRETWFMFFRNGDDLYDVDKRYQVAWGFANSSNEPAYNHTIVEISIPLDILTYEQDTHGGSSVGAGDTIGIMLEGYGTLAPEWVFPTDANYLLNSFNNPEYAADWADLTLGTSAPITPPTEPPTNGVPAEPKDWSQEIGIWFMVIALVVGLGAAIFYKQLGTGVWAVVGAAILIGILGAINYTYGYITYIPYLAPQ